MILVLLVVAWGLVLVPRFLRNHAGRGSRGSLNDFRDRFAVIYQARQPGSAPGRPNLRSVSSRSRAVNRRRTQKRRRDVLAGLTALAVGTLIIGLMPAFRSVLIVHALVDLLLAGYLTLLVRRRNYAIDRRYERPVLSYHPIDD